MNSIHAEILKRANEEAIYIIYVYLAHKFDLGEGKTLSEIADHLLHYPSKRLNARDISRLNIFKNALSANKILSDSKVIDLTVSKRGLTACMILRPDGEISVVFKGTGTGEWIDNGEGLSGIPEENTYIIYNENGDEIYQDTVFRDYATDQQVQALNWFNSVISKNALCKDRKITVSGHSKGGNKAQFIAICSDLVNSCFSFDGHGFSPEALNSFKSRFGEKFTARQQNIFSLSADNDYVNVLGSRLIPRDNIFFLKSQGGFHFPEAILNSDGNLRPLCKQGALSEYIESISNELMHMSPSVRQYATLGVMNVFQKYLGRGAPVNGDSVSLQKTIAGLGVATFSLLRNFNKRSNM